MRLFAWFLFPFALSSIAQGQSRDVGALAGTWNSLTSGCKSVVAPGAEDAESEPGLSFYDTYISWTETSCEISRRVDGLDGTDFTVSCIGPSSPFAGTARVVSVGPHDIQIIGLKQVATDLQSSRFIRCLGGEQAELPPFEKFEAKVKLRQTRPVKLSGSKWSKEFRSRIMQGLKAGANIGGHFTLVGLGCGTQCVNYVLVDNSSGKVGEIVVGSTLGQTVIGVEHRSDSSLLRVKWMDYPAGPCFNTDYLANGLSLKRLKQVQVGVGIDQCFE